MKLKFLYPVVIVGVILLSACTIFPKPFELEITSDLHEGKTLESPVSITIWNLGYGGLGKEQNFFADGGKSWRVSDKILSKKYTSNIVTEIDNLSSDIFLLQEVAKPSFVNRQVDLMGALLGKLTEYSGVYRPQYLIKLPLGLGINTGGMTLSREINPDMITMKIPTGESSINFGRYFFVHRYRFDLNGKPISALNIHLSAFDKDGEARRLQLKEVFNIAQEELKLGRQVIIGGDFNMTFNKPINNFTTNDKDTEWLVEFDKKMLPSGFKLAIDPSRPTFRTLEKSYVKDENYSGFIDGFIVSDGIKVCSITTSDLEFENSDHNPSTLVFSVFDHESKCG